MVRGYEKGILHTELTRVNDACSSVSSFNLDISAEA